MAMTSFYGGPKGQDFEISYVFNNKQALINDLSQSWVSPVALGSYVMISHGEGVTDVDSDKENYGKSYNSTLWRKIYVEEEDRNKEVKYLYHEIAYADISSGIAYGLIATLTGATPLISVDHNVLKANELPSAAINYENRGLENPEIIFSLPKAWDIQKAEDVVLDADQSPTVDFVEDGDNSVKTLTFSLPCNQIIGLGDTSIVNPGSDPRVSLDSKNINNPILTFELPRAVQFYYGNGTTNVQITAAKQGDYYIDKDTAYIYLITGNDGNGLKLEFKANLSGEKPIVNTESINPYNDNGNSVDPFVEASFENPVNKTGYMLTFNLPKAPEIETDFKELGSAESSTLIATKSESGIKLDFEIARGARWFISETTSITAEDVKTGDYCLIGGTSEVDVNRGDIYQFDGSSWVDTGSNILGRTGSGVKVLAKQIITFEEVNDDANEDLMEAELNERGIKPNVDELLPVDYIESDGNTTSYWYYYINNQWYRQVLTGGTAGLITNQYDKNNSTSVGYSTGYLNEQLNLKADKTTVASLADTVAGKASNESVISLTNEVTGVKNGITSLQAEDASLRNSINDLNASVKANAASITNLNNNSSSYLTKDDASNTYLSIKKASDYLTKKEAENSYYTKGYVDQNFLSSDTSYEPPIETLPLSKGGTGASVSSLSDLQTYLGITDINNNIKTINDDIIEINNNTSLKPETGTAAYSTDIRLEVGQMYLQYDPES